MTGFRITFKNFFGIKSPSRLMFAMGGHIATGLGNGIDAHAHRPLRAMERMQRTMLAPMAPAGGGNRNRGGDKVEIHVHQRAGEDGHALARRVAAIIDRRDRGDRLRSYQDDF